MHNLVTPFAGVWIEIVYSKHGSKNHSVTPFAGVWIGILSRRKRRKESAVTPFAGVWIEIRLLPLSYVISAQSLPSRECGLKFCPTVHVSLHDRHSLRGSVD